MSRFYVNLPLEQACEISLPEDVVRHISVLRLRLTDKISLFNGDGYDYVAEFSEFERRKISVKIIAINLVQNESKLKLTLLMSIIASDKFDWVVQKAVELGVASITPLITEHCVVRLDAERMQKKQQQWQAIAIAACEQCGRNCVPDVLPAMTLTAYLQSCHAPIKWVLSPVATQALRDCNISDGDMALLIGPEGGLSDNEIAQASASSFQPLRLGPRVLRTETAAIVALSVLQALAGDL